MEPQFFPVLVKVTNENIKIHVGSFRLIALKRISTNYRHDNALVKNFLIIPACIPSIPREGVSS